MFGGVGFILHGNIVCGIIGNGLIVRVEPEIWDSFLFLPFIHPFMGKKGKPMKGWILVAPGGVAADSDLQKWVEMDINMLHPYQQRIEIAQKDHCLEA
jgi:hypothetical protein